MKIKKSNSDKILDLVCYGFVFALCVTIVIPFWNLFVTSVTPQTDTSMSFQWWPDSATWEAWKMVLKSNFIWNSFKNTVFKTILGTVIHLGLTLLYAYPLSRADFSFNKFFNGLIVASMFIHVGLIPTYLNIVGLGLNNTIWALVLPGAISAYNVILLKNYFKGIPMALTEAARIDGANDIYIFFKIILPLSKPIVATITLWMVVGLWNQWMDCLLYINDRDMYVLPIMLRELQTSVAALTEGGAGVDASAIPPSDALVAASNLFVILPIVCVYPFLQKYFVKGIMAGSVKG